MNLLRTELEQFKQNQRKNISPVILDRLAQAIEELKRARYFARRLVRGDRVPDFSLKSLHGRNIRLSSVLRKSPVVLSFFRGGWCGYDTIELQYLQRIGPQIRNLGARLFCIAPAKSENLSSLQREYSLDFELLFDQGNRVGDLFGIAYPLPQVVRDIYGAFDLDLLEENGDDSYRLPLPVTYVIDQEGKIVLDFFEPDYTQRLEPVEIVGALQILADQETEPSSTLTA